MGLLFSFILFFFAGNLIPRARMHAKHGGRSFTRLHHDITCLHKASLAASASCVSGTDKSEQNQRCENTSELRNSQSRSFGALFFF